LPSHSKRAAKSNKNFTRKTCMTNANSVKLCDVGLVTQLSKSCIDDPEQGIGNRFLSSGCKD